MDLNYATDHVKSSWICIAGLSNELTEGDIITVFSQFGEVVNINLLRQKQTGRSRGICFLCYQDLASTILAVDNFNGITLLRRKLKVNYVDNYKLPKYREDADEGLKQLLEEGCAPKPISLHTTKKHKKNPPLKENDVLKSMKFNPLARFPTVKAAWRDFEIWEDTQKRKSATSIRMIPTCDFVHVPKRYLR
ncbi:unnamed protein product [Cylicocyclus nassatus]|uniref:RRM domain-containing protein n=1 Tax=Cylicocyclus nassatus TaxID=53992 RepID=A0AA36DR53_CYLNA|nr:unnamed protein product [Cylicocyclus nassatus]